MRTRESIQSDLEKGPILSDNEEWGECIHHGRAIFSVRILKKGVSAGYRQRHCKSCAADNGRRRKGDIPDQKLTEKRRRAEVIEESKDDYWGDV